ncbi:MAG: OsmC family protein [Myxococcaceae bacterium]
MKIAHVKSHGSQKYVTEIDARNHHLKADESERLGGSNAGPSPYELLLAGLSACTSITLRMYAERKGWELGEISIDLTLDKENDQDLIRRTIHFSGELSAEQTQRLLEIAEKTPVTLTIKRGANITTTIS